MTPRVTSSGANSLRARGSTQKIKPQRNGNTIDGGMESTETSTVISHEATLRRAKEKAVADRLARIEQKSPAQTEQSETATHPTQEREIKAAQRRRSEELRQSGATRESMRIIERQRQKEEREKGAAVSLQQVILNCIVTFGAGLSVDHVICGFETSQVLTKNLPMKATKSEIIEIFTQSRHKIDVNNLAIMETGATLGRQQATIMAKTGDLEEFLAKNATPRGTILEPLVCGRSSEGRTMSPSTHFSLAVTWCIPTLTMVACYPNLQAWYIRITARKLDGRFLNGQRIQAEYEEQHVHGGYSLDPAYGPTSEPGLCPTVKISLIPPRTTIQEIMAFAGTQNIVPHYTSCTSKEIFDALDAYFRVLPNSTFTGLTFEISPSDPDTGVAKAAFGTWGKARLAYNRFDGNVLRPNFPPLELILPDQYSFTLTLAENEYHAQRSQWDELKNGLDNNIVIQLTDSEDESGRRTIIDLSGQNEKDVGAIKVRIENMIAGKRLDTNYWHPEFKSLKGQKFLDSFYNYTNAYARFDSKHHCVILSGDSEAIGAAKARLQEEIERLSAEKWTIPLQRRMLNFFQKEGLGALKALFREGSILLDEKATKIVLHGVDIEEAKYHVKQLMNAFTSQNLEPVVVSDRICALCSGAISEPVDIPCHHIYCTSCLRRYVLSTFGSHKFPLKCLNSDPKCGSPIPITVIQKLVSPPRFEQLTVAAFRAHLDENRGTFKYCITPGCSQLYRVTTSQTSLRCPSCFSEICTACHAEGHAGITCAMKRAQLSCGEVTSTSRNTMAESEGRIRKIVDHLTRRESDSRFSTLSSTAPGSLFPTSYSSHATTPLIPATNSLRRAGTQADPPQQTQLTPSTTTLMGRVPNGADTSFVHSTTTGVPLQGQTLRPIHRGSQRSDQNRMSTVDDTIKIQRQAESWGCGCRLM